MNLTRCARQILLAAGFIVAAAGLGGTEAGIQFIGYLRDENGLSFALKGIASGNSKWVTAGQEFEDYKVRSLDEKTETLVVAKAGVEFRLPLIRAKVKQVDLEPPPELKKRVLNNLRQLAAAADQFYLEHGVAKASYDDLVGETKYVRRLEPVDGENYKSMEFAQGKTLEVTTNQGYTISYRP